MCSAVFVSIARETHNCGQPNQDFQIFRFLSNDSRHKCMQCRPGAAASAKLTWHLLHQAVEWVLVLVPPVHAIVVTPCSRGCAMVMIHAHTHTHTHTHTAPHNHAHHAHPHTQLFGAMDITTAIHPAAYTSSHAHTLVSGTTSSFCPDDGQVSGGWRKALRHSAHLRRGQERGDGWRDYGTTCSLQFFSWAPVLCPHASMQKGACVVSPCTHVRSH
jgi:hypothetical protein